MSSSESNLGYDLNPRFIEAGRPLIIDPDGTPGGLVRRAMLAADRGDWIRTPEAQRQLIGSVLPIREVVPYRVGFYAEVLYACGVTPSS